MRHVAELRGMGGAVQQKKVKADARTMRKNPFNAESLQAGKTNLRKTKAKPKTMPKSSARFSAADLQKGRASLGKAKSKPKPDTKKSALQQAIEARRKYIDSDDEDDSEWGSGLPGRRAARRRKRGSRRRT